MSDDVTQDEQPTPAPGAARGGLSGWLRGGGWRAVAGAVVGAAGLSAYSYFIGCRTGTCVLTANVQTASLFGALIGLVLGWPTPPRPQKVRVRR